MVKWLSPPFIAAYRALSKLLIRLHVHPNAVTIVGTAGVLFGALYYFPQANTNIFRFFVGTLVCWGFALLDMTDGMIARATGKSSRFGAFLDSTLDRFADAAVFGGIAWALIDRHRVTAVAAILCLVVGSVVPYARARAEGLGIDAKGGIASRADRLVIALIATGLVGLGVDIRLLTVVLFFLTAAATVTVVQRGFSVWKANKADPSLPVAAK